MILLLYPFFIELLSNNESYSLICESGLHNVSGSNISDRVISEKSDICFGPMIYLAFFQSSLSSSLSEVINAQDGLYDAEIMQITIELRSSLDNSN